MVRKECTRSASARPESNRRQDGASIPGACGDAVAEAPLTAEPPRAEEGAATEATLELAALLDDESEPNAAAGADAAIPRVAARARWRQLLAGASPREVLARLVPGDPLALRAVVAERVRERAYLCDADRVFLRAVARVARFSVRYRGQPDIDAWLVQLVDEALLDVLRDELEAERCALDERGQRDAEKNGVASADDPELAVFVDLARPLGLDAAAMRTACSRFNRLPDAERAAFFALLIDGTECDEFARARGKTPTDVARAARRAFEILLAAFETKEQQP